MVSCFVVGCTSGYHGTQTHLFRAPKQADKIAWLKNIPKREIPFDFKRSCVCYLHFEESGIIKSEEFIEINGEKVKLPSRPRWTLKPNAIPTRFSNLQLSSYYDKPGKRKSPKKRLFAETKKPRIGTEEELKSTLFSELKTDPSLIKLPSCLWTVQTQDSDDSKLEPVFIHQITNSDEAGFIVMKTITILHTGEIKVIARGKNVTYMFPGILTITDLEELIERVNDMHICEGATGFSDLGIVNGTCIVNGNLFSQNCETLSATTKCKQCQNLIKKLRVIRSQRRKRVVRRKTDIPSSPSKLKAYAKLLQRRIVRKDSKIRRFRAQNVHLRSMKKKLTLLKIEDIIPTLKKSGLSDNLVMGLSTALKIAKAKSINGNRYEPEWLLQCLLIKIKSPKSYNYLRENQMLPLPHPSTLQRLIRSVRCDYGFQDSIFESMKSILQGKSFKDRQGLLLFDEIKVKESLEFSNSDFQFKGFIDYAEYTSEYLSIRDPKIGKLADHALVFMVRSLNSSWAQPIGAFATRGAAPGFMLSKLVIAAILKLEDSGFRIIGCTCDGASANKSMWEEFGITGKIKSKKTGESVSIIHKVVHPADDSGFLYFLSDVPHMIKCIRNHLLKHIMGQFAGNQVNFNLYSKLYDFDCSLGSLRLAPKITKSHINPSPFQKMVVYYATQLFSRTVADAILICRTQGILGFEDSYSTEKFTREINDLFDALNTNRSSTAIYNMESEKVDTLRRFSAILRDPSNTFASAVTLESMRVTVQSVLEIVEYLLSLGFAFILTNKFNQDCLEKFFGIIRSMGGCDDHPTILNFIQLFRLMCIYIPTRVNISGNISQGEVMPETIFQFSAMLKKQSKLVSDVNRARRTEVEDKILEKIIFDNGTDVNGLREHDYYKSDISDGIVFYLGGYIAFKGSRFTTCSHCQLALASKDCPIVPAAQICKLKSIGSLKFPSLSLFRLLKLLESQIAETLETNLQFEPVFSIIDSLNIKIDTLGCNVEHSAVLIARIVSFYISLRCYFHCKVHNNQILLNKKTTKQDRKKVKLH